MISFIRESFLRRKPRGKASNLRGGEKIFSPENSISPRVNSSQRKLDQSSFLISPLGGIFPPWTSFVYLKIWLSWKDSPSYDNASVMEGGCSEHELRMGLIFFFCTGVSVQRDYYVEINCCCLPVTCRLASLQIWKIEALLEAKDYSTHHGEAAVITPSIV